MLGDAGHIGLVVGGAIVIPRVRRAVAALEEVVEASARKRRAGDDTQA